MAERLVVIGGDAAGMSAATNARRGRPDLEIIVFERGTDTSYAACGIPYVIGGAVADLDELVVRTPQEFRDHHRIDVRTRHQVESIDLAGRRVEVRALDQDRRILVPFDQLMIATGARPLRPNIDGIDQPWIMGVQNLQDARNMLDAMAGGYQNVVVVGGGYIGLEMAEAFVERKVRVTLVERGPHPLGIVDPSIGDRISTALRRFGVEVQTGVEVTGFGDRVVHTTHGDLAADLAVLGLGVGPAAQLGAEAGLELGAKGAIRVNHRQQASHDGVWAAGDCADTFDLVTRDRIFVALGTVANKTGRVAGINLGGGYATFPGVVGTALTRICQVEIGRTGVDLAAAEAAGMEVVVGEVEATSRAGYFPGAADIVVRVLAERSQGRLVGAQIVGPDRVGKRIDVMATAITAGLSVYDLIDLDLGYAPSIATTWDPWQIAARQAVRQL